MNEWIYKRVEPHRWLVSGLPLRRPIFEPGSFHVRLFVGKVVLWQVFLRVGLFLFSAASIIPTRRHTHFRITLNRRRSGRGLGAVKQSNAFSVVRPQTENSFKFFVFKCLNRSKPASPKCYQCTVYYRALDCCCWLIRLRKTRWRTGTLLDVVKGIVCGK